MSTENTQTDVTASGDSAVSAVATTGQDSVTTSAASDNTPVDSFDALKKASKDSHDGVGKFKAKSVDEALKEGAAPAVAGTPAYAANYKYKAALQEKEIEEFWRPLIKDAESEKKVKELMSRVDGFDFVKSSRDKVQQQLESLNNDYQTQSEVVKKVEGSLAKGDLTSAFRQLGVSRESVLRWTQEQLQMMELPPEQRKAFEEAEGLRTQQEQLKEQMTQYQRMYEEQSVQARTLQLDYVISRPEISQAAQSWDNLQGQPGAFRDLVIQEAQTAYYQTGKDLTAEQAAQLVMQKFGKVLSNGGGSQAIVPQAQTTANQTPVVTAPQAKPIIPNINGKGAAPIKKVPRSIEDLKRMGKELQALESSTN